MAWLWFFRRAADQVFEPRAGDVAVAGLTAFFTDLNDDRTFFRPAPTGDPLEAALDRLWEVGGTGGFEAQFDRRIHFVHVLPTRAACADEVLGNLPIFDLDAVVDPHDVPKLKKGRRCGDPSEVLGDGPVRGRRIDGPNQECFGLKGCL